MNQLRFLGLAVLATLLSPGTASACAVCMGGKDSNVANSANGAIFLMLGMVAFVGSFFFGFLIYLVRCERRPVPPHRDLDHLLEEGGSAA